MAAGQSQPAIRPARPEDVSFIARNILSSQRGPFPRGWFDIALGWNEPQCLSFVECTAIAQTRSWWHITQFIVAEVEGHPAASLCALPATGTEAAARAAIKEVATAIGLSATDLTAIFRRGAYGANCWVQGGEGEWLIEHVATLPEYRGRGLVQALIDHALSAGKQAGFNQASISFLIGNEAAERCYAKAGFTFAEEKRDPAFESITGSPGFRRFTRAI
ncbi:GNAT family N-acetyltransferase [Bradyrhizobium sp. WSM 1738]|uniref:GNAT family N-acetyltransferase n=1 Tax=Bradyrhizobium hereditatis TaxID=2821405 RepID=UPI001CE24B1C|nr:GNAT family N-acetyltransferase [Bradyrhizobium hereditatis]MCA6118116.1 GNAT family N-acetyltransferase [Bradyrhizobium hereditatis]